MKALVCLETVETVEALSTVFSPVQTNDFFRFSAQTVDVENPYREKMKNPI